MRITQQPLWTLCFIVGLGLTITSYTFEYVYGLEPCVLCLLQRYTIMALTLVFLAALVHQPKSIGTRLYSMLTFALSVMGLAIAGRHLWLQHLPKDQVPACGPSLDYLLDTLPFFDALSEALKGSGDCAKISWQLLGLSLPAWLLMVFFAMCLASIVSFMRGKM